MTKKEIRMQVYEANLRDLRKRYPCRGCVYYAACGDPERVRECDGMRRMVKRKLIVRKRSGVVKIFA